MSPHLTTFDVLHCIDPALLAHVLVGTAPLQKPLLNFDTVTRTGEKRLCSLDRTSVTPEDDSKEEEGDHDGGGRDKDYSDVVEHADIVLVVDQVDGG